MSERAFLGVDLGGTNTKIAVVDEDGKVLQRSTIPTRAMRKAEEVIEDIAQEAVRLKESVTAGVSVEALGIGIPGLID
ncbi:MAG: ROK family protein, partial [Synergistales bacterium]|nr:ROK family protein [Synergistales bacterium]